MSRAAILGCSGPVLTAQERDFFRELKPWGFILFARNIESIEQTRALTEAMREAAEDADALVFIDQEGGRVQRMRPPLAEKRRPAEPFGELYKRDPDSALEAVRLNHRLMADELRAAGFDADCAPCLDLRFKGASDVIGDRSFGHDPSTVAALGRAAIDGLTAGGVAPVIKHMPGHGRARVDSHFELPVVDASLAELEQNDFEPFRALADTPMGMSAHLVFTAIDPEIPATLSHHVISTVIRGHIGFDGLLMTDDLSMKALGGTMRERSDRAIQAGCDMLLHCNGEMDEMVEVAAAAPRLSGKAAERAEAARASARRVQDFDAEAASDRLAELGLGGRMAA